MAIKINYHTFHEDRSELSSEEIAALELKKRFQEEFAGTLNSGEIHIITGARIFGQERTDIDMILIGVFDNMVIKNVNVKFRKKNNSANPDQSDLIKSNINQLNIRSFICNIELKSHSAGNVCRKGVNYFVKYPNCMHNATEQAYEEKFSLRGFCQDFLGINPFVSDLLWFNGLSPQDLEGLRGNVKDNALPAIFSFRDLIDSILLQSDVLEKNSSYYLDSFSGGQKDIKIILDAFAAKRVPVGLTKTKFELISQDNIDNLIQGIQGDLGEKLTILRGRAGTGKTIFLLQLAFFEANEENKQKCLILTYNNALVSDIRRLIDYTPMPTDVDGRMVKIKTIDSFFLALMRVCKILDAPLNAGKPDYSILYSQALNKLDTYLTKESDNLDVLKALSDEFINWDLIFIDEAQDFSPVEKNIIITLYGADHVIVADGIDQFMRMGEREKWDKGDSKQYIAKSMTLERRQKYNLISFVNAYASISGLSWKVKPNATLPGGNVLICSGYDSTLHGKLMDNCQKNNCENYDILILEPPTRISNNGSQSYFTNAAAYKKANISIYDGTNSSNRTTYPVRDECRLFQYHSCRGLEGWCVVCDCFDELVEWQMSHMELDDSDVSGLNSDIAKWRKVMLWTLMPLTRAVDTLVITLKDPDSRIGKTLKKLADDHSDFITWNIN